MARLLTTQFIKDKLLLYNSFTTSSIPPDAWIEDVADTIEDRIENWVGYKLGVNAYTETYTTDDLGRIQLRQYPVRSIVKVEQLLPRIVDGVSGVVPIPSFNYNAVGSTNQRGIVWFAGAEMTLVVNYIAGHDEVPSDFLNTIFATFMELLKHVVPPGYPDWNFLSEPTRDYTSISLPGGLSKSFELGKSSGSAGIASRGTIQDRLFAPLNKYRRLYLL